MSDLPPPNADRKDKNLKIPSHFTVNHLLEYLFKDMKLCKYFLIGMNRDQAQASDYMEIIIETKLIDAN